MPPITPRKKATPGATYMKRVREFALRPLKSDAEHARAVRVIEKWIGRDLDAGASDYLDTLILLVNKYEDENHTVGDSSMTPRQALRAIMDANGMTQAQMGQVIGSESALSMFLKGERGLSKNHIKALVSRFRVDAALFL